VDRSLLDLRKTLMLVLITLSKTVSFFKLSRCLGDLYLDLVYIEYILCMSCDSDDGTKFVKEILRWQRCCSTDNTVDDDDNGSDDGVDVNDDIADDTCRLVLTMVQMIYNVASFVSVYWYIIIKTSSAQNLTFAILCFHRCLRRGTSCWYLRSLTLSELATVWL